MSRTGKKPIQMPDKVKANVNEMSVHVEGPLGKLDVSLTPFVSVQVDAKQMLVSRKDDTRQSRQAHGLARALLQNAVSGVSTGFKKNLEIEGVGYRAEVKGEILNLTLGFSHPVEFAIPKGIKIIVDKLTKLSVSGFDRNLVGEVSAKIRGYKPPEPYKGKGIKYEGEYIQRKVGKAAAAAGK